MAMGYDDEGLPMGRLLEFDKGNTILYFFALL